MTAVVAVGTWAVTALALVVLAGPGPRAWALLVVAASGVAVVAVRRTRPAGLAATVVLGCLASAALVTSLRVQPLLDDPLVAEAGSRAPVVADLVLVGDPQPRVGRTSGSRRTDDGWSVDVAVRRWRASTGAPVATDLPARLLGDGALVGLLPGTVVQVRARVLAGSPLRGQAVVLVAESVGVLTGAPPVQAAAGRVRAALRAAVAGRPPDQAGLLPGLVVGDTAAVPAELDAAMRDSGLTHLVAVSGGNVAVVVLVVLGVARSAGLRRGRAQVLVVALGVAAYVVLARPQPSVVRAAAMAGLVLLAVLLDVRARPLQVLGAAVTGLLLLDPFLAVSVGFAMSVAATLALLLLTRWWAPAQGRPRVVRAVLGLVAVSTAAQLAVTPLVVGIGGGVPVGGVVANLLAAPAVAPATSLGLVAAVVGVVAPGAAAVVALPACWAVGWVALVARVTAERAGVLPWPDGWAGALSAVLVLALGAGVLLVARRCEPPVRRSVAVVSVVGLVVVLVPPAAVPRAAAWPPPGWRIVQCDVGQGDAIVLRAGEGRAVVVDAGPDPRALDRCLGRLGVLDVPLLVLSHFHADHVEGLPGLLRGRTVGAVAVSPLDDPPEEVARVRRRLGEVGVAPRVAAPGDRWSVGGVRLEVVWPTRLLLGEGSDPNNASVTLVGSVDGVSVLLPGDLEPAAQEAVLAAGGVRPVDVVEVPHHGSSHQAPGFVTTARPRVALVGVGVDNDYGHPAASTLTAYRAVGALVGRTDLDGDLAVVVDGSGALGLVRRGR